MENILSIILSSTVVSILVSWIANYYIENKKFNHDYWKITIEKRLTIYEQIEQIIVFFQTSHFVKDSPCHLAFLNQNSVSVLQCKLGILSWKRNWISTNLFNELLSLNRLLLNCNDLRTEEEITNFGIEHYQEIVIIRDKLLTQISIDYANMSNVKGFFKNKIKENKLRLPNM